MIKENKLGKKYDKREKVYSSSSQKSILSKGRSEIKQQLEDIKKKKMMKEKLERFKPNNNFRNNNFDLSNANKKIIQLLSEFMEVYKSEEKKNIENKHVYFQDANQEIKKTPSGINKPISIHMKMQGSKKTLYNRVFSYKKKPIIDNSNSSENLLYPSLKNSLKPISINYNLNQNINNIKIVNTDHNCESSFIGLSREKSKKSHKFNIPYLALHKKNDDKSNSNDNIINKKCDKKIKRNSKNDSENFDIQLNKNLLNSSSPKIFFNPLGCRTIESLEKETEKEFESGRRTMSINSSSSNNELYSKRFNTYTKKKNLIRAKTAYTNKREDFKTTTISALSSKKRCDTKKTLGNYNLKYKFDIMSEETEIVDCNNTFGISSIINRIKKTNQNKYKTKEKDVIFLSRIQEKLKQSIIGLDKEDYRQFRREMKENEDNEITKVINNLPIKRNSLENDSNRKLLSKADLISIKSIKSSKDYNQDSKENSLTNIDNYIDNNKKHFEMKHRMLHKKKYVYDSLDDEEIEEDEYDVYYLNPHSVFIYFLDTFVGISALISLFYVPFYLSYNQQFCKKFFEPSEFILILVDIIYICDLSIGFFKAYYNFDEYLVRNTKSICKNYLKTWFILDFLLAFPTFSLITFKLPKCNKEKISTIIINSRFYEMNIKKLHLLLITVKSLKIFKVFISNNSFRLFFKNILLSDIITSWHKVIIYFFMIFSVIHFYSCLFIFIGRNEYPNWILAYNLSNENYRDVYISSVYFIMATVTSVGYGDVVAFNLNEKIFQCIILISGTIAYSWIVSSLSNYIKKQNEKSIAYEKRVKILEEIQLKNPQLSRNLYEKIARFIHYRKYSEKHDRNLILDNLPISLRNSLVIEMYKPIVNKFIFFKNFQNADFIVRVILAFKPILAVKGDLLVQEGEFLEDIIFVKEGVLSLEISIDLNNPEKSVEAYLKGKGLGKNNEKKINKKFELLEKKSTNSNNIENNENEKIPIEYQRISSILQNNERQIINERNKNIRYIRIIDIRKNEHFGEVLMFLNERSPLCVKVKSKKSELFFLKKTDAIEISSSYPNIWKRINMKSLFNMQQIKNLIRRVVLIFCNIQGIKTKKGESKDNSRSDISNEEDFKHLMSLGTLGRTKSNFKVNTFKRFATQQNKNSIIYEETMEDKENSLENSLRNKVKLSNIKSEKEIKHVKSNNVIRNKLKNEIDIFNNEKDNCSESIKNNILNTVSEFHKNENEVKSVINNTNNIYLSINYNNNCDHCIQNALISSIHSLNNNSNFSKQFANSFSENIKSKMEKTDNTQQIQSYSSILKDKDISPKSIHICHLNNKLELNKNQKIIKESKKKSNSEINNQDLYEQTEKCEIENKPISINESDLLFSDNDKNNNNNKFLERFNFENVNEEMHSSDEIISGLNIKNSLLSDSPKNDINDVENLSKRMVEKTWFNKLKKQSKQLICNYINNINDINDINDTKHKNYKIQKLSSFELESSYDNINEITYYQYIKDNRLQVITKEFLKNECNINKNKENKENRLSLKMTKNKLKNKSNNLNLCLSINNLKKIKTNQVLSPFKVNKNSLIFKESLIRVPSEGDLLNQFLSIRKPSLTKIQGSSKKYGSCLTKDENQKTKKENKLSIKKNIQTIKSKNNLSNSEKSSSDDKKDKKMDRKRSKICDSLCKNEVEYEPNFYTKMKTIDKRLNFTKTNKLERKIKKQNNNGILAKLTQNMREDSTNLKNPQEYFNGLLENIYTKEMNVINNRKNTKIKNSNISETTNEKIKRNKTNTYFKNDNMKSLKRNAQSIKNVMLSISKTKKHKENYIHSLSKA